MTVGGVSSIGGTWCLVVSLSVTSEAVGAQGLDPLLPRGLQNAGSPILSVLFSMLVGILP